MSDIEGKVAREAMSECGQRASFNPFGVERVKRRGRHAPLPRKAVEPRCYICVRLRRPVFERLVPAKSNHGRNEQDYDQHSSHDLLHCQKRAGEIN